MTRSIKSEENAGHLFIQTTWIKNMAENTNSISKHNEAKSRIN